MKQFFVYILSSRSRSTYVGVTNDLTRRLFEHHAGMCTFTSKYRIHRLVYFEVANDANTGIAREKQIKAYRREKKAALITSRNPDWSDLSLELGISPGSFPSASADPSRSLPSSAWRVDPSLRSG